MDKNDIERLKAFELKQMGDGIRSEIKNLSRSCDRIGLELSLIRKMMEKIIDKKTYNNVECETTASDDAFG